VVAEKIIDPLSHVSPGNEESTNRFIDAVFDVPVSPSSKKLKECKATVSMKNIHLAVSSVGMKMSLN